MFLKHIFRSFKEILRELMKSTPYSNIYKSCFSLDKQSCILVLVSIPTGLGLVRIHFKVHVSINFLEIRESN